MLLGIALYFTKQILSLIDSNPWLVATLLNIWLLHLQFPFPILHAPTGHDSFTLPISCMRLPAMIPLSLIFLLSFFDNHLTKNCPIFTNLPLHKNNKKTFFCFTNIWPTITLSKLPHFSSNLPLHKNYSFLPFSTFAPMLQL